MGTKYIVEVEDKPFELLSEDGFTSEKLFRVKGFNSLVFDWNGLNMLTPYTAPDLEQVRKEAYKKGYETAKHECEDCTKPVDNGKAYQQGLSDAWEAARKVTQARKYGGYGDCLGEVFGRNDTTWDVFDYSATEVIEKIRQYEQEKEEQITKGDIVLIKSTSEVEILVTYADEEYVSGIALTEVDGNCEIGDQYTNIRISNVEKTGKHYDIVSVLAKMKETDNG